MIQTIITLIAGVIAGIIVFLNIFNKKQKSLYKYEKERNKLDKEMAKEKEKYENMTDQEKVDIGNDLLDKRRNNKWNSGFMKLKKQLLNL